MKGRPAMPAQNVVVIGPVTEDELDELFELADELNDDDSEDFVVIEVVDDLSYLEDDEIDDDELDDDELYDNFTELMILAFLIATCESLLRKEEELELQGAIADNEGWPPASDD